ncbi:MAG: phosphosulfolactate synthase [Acidimicrobiales bacterium]
MSPSYLSLPDRSAKPRRAGLTMVIDNGLPLSYFVDAVSSAAAHIDAVKFGWGTCLVTDTLDRKIDCLRDQGIRFWFGGTLFEKFVVQHRFESFLELCRHWRASTVEVSNGTIPLTNSAKAAYIRTCAREFDVVSEVGFKDAGRSERLSSSNWVDSIGEDLEAGSSLVIAEARENGRSGTCRPDGTLRAELLDDILDSGIDADRLLFEAPTKDLQTQFVTRLGANANLGNIAVGEVIGLETLRLGLRADTLLHFETVAAYA